MITSNRRIRYPGLLVSAWFAGVILLGTLLLSLPVSRADPDVGVSDALFTAVSAVTVTGLAVVDTGTAWTPFGKGVLLLLIQIGGLGVLTIAGFLGIALNRRLGVRSGLLAGAEIGLSDLGVLRTLIGDIIRFVLVAEATVAVLLTVHFSRLGFDLPEAAFHGVFHAVSAFNNAGFSPLPGGLEGYTTDWVLNLLLAGLFILGGIGFPVVFELRRAWRRPATWTLHTKVTLTMSAALLGIGTVLFAAIEWDNAATMGPLGWADKLLASFFQSATARTAGFNTVPIGALHTGSLMVMILLMVIGASSASTGGGIKTSTFAVAVRSALAELRGDESTTLFSRQIPVAHQRQALSLVIATLGAVGTGAFVLALGHGHLPLAWNLFEAASAFGTVGLTAGATSELDGLGRLVIIGLMFLGRVGPMTFGTAVLLRGQRRQYAYPEEPLIVG